MARRQLQGLSQRAYAEHRGVSHTAVGKALRKGRITKLPDGSIDPARADREWLANTDETKSSNSVSGSPRHRRDPAAPPTPAGTNTPDAELAEGTSYTRARGAREGYTALLQRLKYQREMGSLVEVDRVRAGAFAAAQRTKNALLAMPAQLASRLMNVETLDEMAALLLDWARATCKDLQTPTAEDAQEKAS